jgi:hypothetical protein
MPRNVSTNTLDGLEINALSALVRLAGEGNATAASQALLAIQRMREKGAAALHRSRLEELSDDGPGMAGYLAMLGLSRSEVESRLGHKLKPAEAAAWEQGQEDRLLEVRAVEIQRMRTSCDVPRWATRRLK